MGSGSKSYMRRGFLIYEEMHKFFLIYEDAVSHIWLCTWSLWISSYMREILFSFYQCSFTLKKVNFQKRKKIMSKPRNLSNSEVVLSSFSSIQLATVRMSSSFTLTKHDDISSRRFPWANFLNVDWLVDRVANLSLHYQVLRRENQGLKVYPVDDSSVFSMTGTCFWFVLSMLSGLIYIKTPEAGMLFCCHSSCRE